MNRIRWLALGLGASYAVGAGILLLVEPGMGFRSFADFWNPDLVVPALTSTAWLANDLYHLVSGTLLLVLAASLTASNDPLSRLVPMLGLAAGATFILLPGWFVALSLVVGVTAIGFVVAPSAMPVALAAWAFTLAWVWRSPPW
jgi:hypothetical protein